MLVTTISLLLRILSNPIGNVFQKKLTEQNNHPLLVNLLTFPYWVFFVLFQHSNKIGDKFPI